MSSGFLLSMDPAPLPENISYELAWVCTKTDIFKNPIEPDRFYWINHNKPDTKNKIPVACLGDPLYNSIDSVDKFSFFIRKYFGSDCSLDKQFPGGVVKLRRIGKDGMIQYSNIYDHDVFLKATDISNHTSYPQWMEIFLHYFSRQKYLIITLANDGTVRYIEKQLIRVS